MHRREVLKTSAAALGTLLGAGAIEAYPMGVNTSSRPSKLKITDLRVATIVKPGPSPCPLVRIDTDQGVYGLGEVRDGASPTYALFLLRENTSPAKYIPAQAIPSCSKNIKST